jgi:hypothetical protein
MTLGGDDARAISASIVDAVSRLSSYQSMTVGLTAPLDRLRSLAVELSTAPESPEPTNAQTVERWRRDVAAQIDVVQQELRLLRKGSKFAS